MDLPILGTIDLTPTGIFLFFAAVLAVGYFGWQLFGIGRAGRDAAAPDATPAEGSQAEGADAGEAEAADADGPLGQADDSGNADGAAKP